MTQPKKPEEKKKRGRPPMTEEQKAKAKAEREWKKKHMTHNGTGEGPFLTTGHNGDMLEPDKTARLELVRKALFAMPMFDIRKATTEEIQKRIEEYFTICVTNNTRPVLSGIAFSLGANRNRIYEICRGGNANGYMPYGLSEESAAVIRRACAILEMQMETYLVQGQINPASGIFLAKNHWGYRDQVENVVITDGRERVDVEALRQTYMLESDDDDE